MALRAALTVLTLVLVAGCAGNDRGGGAADPAGSGSQSAGAAACHPDEAMGRPCPAPSADLVQSRRPRYITDKGDAYEQYNGATYHGDSFRHCKARLHESFQAYKACVRY